MESNSISIRDYVLNTINSLLDNRSITVTEELPLIGSNGALDSMKLVELCLILEDRATELGFEFDWTSEDAMSKSRSMFRTAGALINEFKSQMESSS